MTSGINCEWTDWKDASECSVLCGDGTKNMTRTKKTTENYGVSCNDNRTSTIEHCKDKECPGIVFVTYWDKVNYSTSKCLNTKKSSYHLDTTCIHLSNMADGAFNGLYKKHNDTFYVHTTPAKTLILKYGYENGWNGCHGNETLMDPGCLSFPYRR